MRRPPHPIAARLLLCALLATAAAGEVPLGFPEKHWYPLVLVDDSLPTKELAKKVAAGGGVTNAGIGQPVIYLPPGITTLRGTMLWLQFHSGDPRELARMWKMAAIIYPWSLIFDLGIKETGKRADPRLEQGQKPRPSRWIWSYIDTIGRETGHPELSNAPLVAWGGQVGGAIYNDLFKAQPQRVLTCGFIWHIDAFPDLLKAVPIAAAGGGGDRADPSAITARAEALAGQRTVPTDLFCRATMYGFGHGIFSSWNFTVGFMDDCIRQRYPAEQDPAKGPVRLTTLDPAGAWVGDASYIGDFAPIAPAAEAKGMVRPVYLPSERFAYTWRAYHCAKPDIRMSEPVTSYVSGGGPQCGLGYNNPTPLGRPVTVACETKASYRSIELFDGATSLGSCSSPPFQVQAAFTTPGLHILHAIGTMADGSRKACHPAYLVVQ